MLEEIEKLLKKIGGRFIIVEDGKPRYIILDFQEFKKLVEGLSENNPEKGQDLEKANEKFSRLKEEDSGPPIKIPEPQAGKSNDLMVEDIPLE